MNFLFSILTGFLMVLSTSAVMAQESHPTCPEKVLGRGTIEGVYKGIECGDMCYVQITLDNGDDLSLLASEEDAGNFFGDTGNRVSATFEVQQFLNPYDPDICSRYEVLIAGHALPRNQIVAAESGGGQSTPSAIQMRSTVPVWGQRDTVFEIWQSTEMWHNHFATYQFTADSQGSIPANLEVTELKIETNHGLIEFDGIFTDSTAGRYGTGNLTVDMDGYGDIKEFIITGATGKIDGKLYDLSDNIRVSDYKPLPLRLGKKIQNSGK